MSNDNKKTKNNAPCEEKQEARELTPDELAKVNGGVLRRRAFAGQCLGLSGCYGVSTGIHGVEDEAAIPPCR